VTFSIKVALLVDGCDAQVGSAEINADRKVWHSGSVPNWIEEFSADWQI
jgi:hypothetical protein